MRKWTYLVATLLIAGTTATFTGCIDTDEPAGITELRGAKSELVKAQAAVELAKAEFKKAKVAEQELVNAGKALDNKAKEINLQLKELDVQLKKLKVEKEEAATAIEKAKAERDIAEIEKQKAGWENEKALAAERFKADMIAAEQATAQAQEAYRQAMEQIEASKILLTDEEQARLNIVEAKVAYAKIAMDKAMFGYSTTVVNKTVFEDGKFVYDISQHPENAQWGYQHGSLKYLQEQLADYPKWVADGNIEAKLKLAVEMAEADLNKAQKEADGYKAILDNEYTTLADWEAEVKKLKDEMAALDVQKRQSELEKEKLKVANPKLEKNKTDAKNNLAKAKDALNNVKNTTKVASAYSKKADKSILEGLNNALLGISDGVAGYDPSTGEFSYAKTVLVTDAQKMIDGWNKLIDAATQGINTEDIAWSELELNKAKAEKEKAQETYESDKEAWVEARDNYLLNIEKINVDASKKDAENAIETYNKLDDAARTQDVNISKVVNALSKYYKDARDRECKSTIAKVRQDATNSEKAISEWIIADPLGNFKSLVGVELGLIKWTTNGTLEKASKIEGDNIISQLFDLGEPAGDTPYISWQKASTKVFGDVFNSEGKPRRENVSEKMILDAVGGNSLALALRDGIYGTYGISIYTAAEVDRLTAVINQADTYKALKAELAAQNAKEQATLDKKKTELAAKVTKAETAFNDAKEAYDKVFKKVEDDITKVSEDYDAKEAIKVAIETAISNYIGSLDDFNVVSGADKMTLEEIKEVINSYYLAAVNNLQNEQANLAKAKRNVEKFAEGTYTDHNFIEDTLANIQEKIKVQQAEYDAAKADYDAASEQLKALLAIFLK